MSTAAYQSLTKRRRDLEVIAVVTVIAFALTVLAWSRVDWPPRAMTDPHSTSRVQ